MTMNYKIHGGGMARPRARFVREAADVRRQALIEATGRCLAEKGVSGTSVRAICARAGVSSGLLTHYFDGVDALILATYAEVGAKVSRALDLAVEEAGADPRERLRACLQANFRAPVLDPDLLATWIAFWSLVKTSSRTGIFAPSGIRSCDQTTPMTSEISLISGRTSSVNTRSRRSVNASSTRPSPI